LGVKLGVAAEQHLINMGVGVQPHLISLGLAAEPHPKPTYNHLLGIDDNNNNNWFYPSNQIYVFLNSNKIHCKFNILMNLIKFIMLIIILNLFGPSFYSF
jgi:hypothetical protein